MLFPSVPISVPLRATRLSTLKRGLRYIKEQCRMSEVCAWREIHGGSSACVIPLVDYVHIPLFSVITHPFVPFWGISKERL